MGTIHAVLSWWDSFDVLVTPVTLEIGMLQQATAWTDRRPGLVDLG